MSRTAHFGVAVTLGLLGWFWCWCGFVSWGGLAISKDSVPGASLFDADFIALYIIWGCGFLGILWGILWSLGRTFRPPRKDLSRSPPEPVKPQQDFKTPDEKLAHCARRRRHEDVV